MYPDQKKKAEGEVPMRIGALEAGGTKMVLGVFDEEGHLLEDTKIPTRAPAQTMPEIISWFQEKRIERLGIGTFGPVDLRKTSPDYGTITATPKLDWRNYPMYSTLAEALQIPCAIDTDVNAAALAECRLGAARGCENAVYVTVGTGIGAGVCVGGKPVHGLMHPEVGHMLLRPNANDPLPGGICPYHESCLEGLASGPAIAKRAGTGAENLPADDPVFTLEADYLAQMCVNLIVILSPEKIVIGGGVLGQEHLMERIRKETVRLLGGYIQAPEITARIESYIVLPALYPISGLIGAWLLARDEA